MTDKEIIKALECCISTDNINPKCESCPYDGDDLLRPCNYNLMKDALDLINRLQAQNDRDVKVKVEALYKVNDLKIENNRQQAEIERLKAKVNHFQYLHNVFTATPTNRIKAEAIKEFAERLKAETKGLLGANFVDDLVKEMVGEEK